MLSALQVSAAAWLMAGTPAQSTARAQMAAAGVLLAALAYLLAASL